MNIIITLLIIIVLIHSFFIFYLSKYVAEFLNSFRISGGQAVPEKLKIGQKVPLFRDIDHLNRKVALSENKGLKTLLVFARSSCFYCRNIIPELDDISEKYDIRVIVIAQTTLDYNLNYGHIIKSQSIFKEYKIKTVPTMLLIDTDSYLVAELDVLEPKGLRILLDHHLSYKELSKTL
ncbi:conjugal transfer protein TraF [Bacillus inaquosorum]|uniref:TlpA family protein disulfide reductase n=1 Tax=Bacillus inaquosorum TaxID=483913 RepID=UPI002282E46A|nr:conjugal transfer protein TraF [Bacillus inaquosorum]MCY7908307.1 conjugal transfer protein TraF [Bacillus inaquosorum]